MNNVKISLIVGSLIAANALFGMVTELHEDGFTVKPNPCPNCPMRMRFTSDGKMAFVNTSRVGEKDFLVESRRALMLMKLCAETAKLTNALRMSESICSSWPSATNLIERNACHLPEATSEFNSNPYLHMMNQKQFVSTTKVVSRDGDTCVMVKDADNRLGRARYLALFNAEDRSREFSVNFADLELDGDVRVFDLDALADLEIQRTTFTVNVPAHAVKFFRLDAAVRGIGNRATKTSSISPTQRISCTLTVTPIPGESHISNSRSSRILTSGSTFPQTGSKTIRRNMKWRLETRFRDYRPDKLNCKVYYLGTSANGKIIQLGKTMTQTLQLDKNGRASIELTSPTVSFTKSRTSTGGSSRYSSGFRSTKTTTRGERVSGCIIQLFADDKLVKSWSSDSRWSKSADQENLSISELNQNKSKIGLR